MEYITIIIVIEAFYILYMFNFFKTEYSIHNPFEKFFTNNILLSHPIASGKYENKICILGNITGYILCIWIFIRLFYLKKNKITSCVNNLIWISIAIIAFILNFNAFIYLIPLLIFEYYWIT